MKSLVKVPKATAENIAWHDIQGLVRTGYGGYTQSAFIRISFDSTKSQQVIGEWLQDLLPSPADTESTKPYKICHGDFDPSEKEAGSTVKLCIAFSVAGLKRFGLPSSALHTFPLEFIDGMASERSAAVLGDQGSNHFSNWYWGKPEENFDVALLAFSHEKAPLLNFIDSLRAQELGKIEDLMTYIKEHEHFGFKDGISNPVITGANRKSDADTRNPEGTIAPGEFIFGYGDQRGLLPLSPTAPRANDYTNSLPRAQPEMDCPDGAFKLDRNDLGNNGSFLVVRQLEQDVDKFNDYLYENGTDKAEYHAAKIMGRWRDGTPLTLSSGDTPPTVSDPSNHFHFQGADTHGNRCPLGAHIRRSNPRDSIHHDPKLSWGIANRHRILRRGRLYDEDGKRGLLFMCLNVNIARQFEHIQSNWINGTRFAHEYETDPITGSRHTSDAKFTIPKDTDSAQLGKLPDFVYLRGGAYLFLPSLSALRYLANLSQSHGK